MALQFLKDADFADNITSTKTQNSATTIEVNNVNDGTTAQARFMAVSEAGNIQVKAVSILNETYGAGDAGIINCDTMSGGFMIAHNDVVKYTMASGGGNTWESGGTFKGNLVVQGTANTLNTGNSGTFVTNDSNNYPRITTASSTAQLGLFRSGTSIGGMYIGADSGGFEVMTSAFSTKFSVDN